MKNSSDTIGNRTRDLPSCNAVPQTNATPRAPMNSAEQNSGEGGAEVTSLSLSSKADCRMRNSPSLIVNVAHKF